MNPDWSPNGKKIVFELERKGPSAEESLDVRERNGVRILTPRGLQGQPSFSPDGGSIVYERDSPGATRASGSCARTERHQRVTRKPFPPDTDPNFSPDGKPITFVRIKKEHGCRRSSPSGPMAGAATADPLQLGRCDQARLVAGRQAHRADHERRLRATGRIREPRHDPAGRHGNDAVDALHRRKENAFAGSFSPDGKQIVFRLEQGDTSAWPPSAETAARFASSRPAKQSPASSIGAQHVIHDKGGVGEGRLPIGRRI